MNGIRPQEILEVLRAIEGAEAAGQRMVLATVVSLDGSVYARAGAMALFAAEPEERAEAAAGAEVQGGLRAAMDAVAAKGRPKLVALDLAEDDPILGCGLGAPGRVEVLLEPAGPRLRDHFRAVRDRLSQGQGLVSAVELEGARTGERALYAPDAPEARECYREAGPQLIETTAAGKVRRTFLCPIQPMGKVMVFGSDPGAAALARHLSELGFTVFAADPRPGRLLNAGWERRRSHARLIEGSWEQARSAAGPDKDTAVVIMTHSYALDLETLQGALKSPAFYVGVVGPQKRTQRMLEELEPLEVTPRPGVLFAPAGVDIGAETPRELAIGIAAEILAARSGLRAGRLGTRSKAAPAPAKAAGVPGLILAAGRGRRFSAGRKLLAAFDGRPVLRHAVDNALASRLDPVIVVLGCDAEAGLQALAGIEDPRLRVVFNPLWEGGKASTIEVGLREVPLLAPGFVALLGDMPMVKPWLIDRVIEEFELSGRLTFPVYPGTAGPTKGWPTAFPRALFGEIRQLTGDDTAVDAVREHWSEAVKVRLDDAYTQADVDTTDDLELLSRAPS